MSADMKTRTSLVLNCFFELERNCCWKAEHIICIFSDALPLPGAFSIRKLTMVMHSMQNKCPVGLTLNSAGYSRWYELLRDCVFLAF